MELFITLCILLNTAFMAMEHHDMKDPLPRVLIIGNYVSANCKVHFIGERYNCYLVYR